MAQVGRKTAKAVT